MFLVPLHDYPYLTQNRRNFSSSSARPHLVISTYGLLRDSTSDFVGSEYSYFQYVALDEGHTIKNHNSLTSKSCRQVCQHPETRRLMLTGTPIMNKLEVCVAVVFFSRTRESDASHTFSPKSGVVVGL